MQSAYRLPFTFDVDRMLSELSNVERDVSWLDHPDYTVASGGDWKAVALLSATGCSTTAESLRYRGGEAAKPTEILRMCPYLAEVIGSFKTGVHRARLMNLKPGTRITEHRDYGAQRYSVERGYIRVHIPIRTDERVHFFVSGQRVPFRAGEAWYINVCEPHAVHNRSDVYRVHLVLDMRVNDWLLSLLPEQSLGDRAYGWVVRKFEARYLRSKRSAISILADARKTLGDLGLRRLKATLTSSHRR